MVGIEGARVLAILTRAPSSGGKTRLFAALERRPDPLLLQALLLDTVAATVVPDVRRIVAVTPASACCEVRTLLDGGADVIPQQEGDLGARMRAVMTELFARGAAAVVLLGSDLPHITPSVIAAAFEWLLRDPRDLVVGPAADGGYYLLGATAVPDVFDGIAWGGGRVLQQTQQAAKVAGLRVHLLDVLADIDTPDDLRQAARSGAAPRVAAWVEQHLHAGGAKGPLHGTS